MLFDINNLFFHAGTNYGFTTGEFMSLVGATASTSSLVINLGQPRDLGIGDGEFVPKVALYLGSAGITSSSASMTLNFQFQGSTNSTTWTTYAETGFQTTASYLANAYVLPIDVPKRPSGVALPQYYQINVAISNTGNAGTLPTASISSGTIIGGLVVQRADGADTLGSYASNFTVA